MFIYNRRWTDQFLGALGFIHGQHKHRDYELQQHELDYLKSHCMSNFKLFLGRPHSLQEPLLMLGVGTTSQLSLKHHSSFLGVKG